MKEEELKYFLIRWLIRSIIRIESKYVNIWFCGISFRRRGKKQYNGNEYPFLLRLFFPFVYVYETENGGFSGDFFAGTIYYRIFPFVYLVFDYET